MWTSNQPVTKEAIQELISLFDDTACAVTTSYQALKMSLMLTEICNDVHRFLKRHETTPLYMLPAEKLSREVKRYTEYIETARLIIAHSPVLIAKRPLLADHSQSGHFRADMDYKMLGEHCDLFCKDYLSENGKLTCLAKKLCAQANIEWSHEATEGLRKPVSIGSKIKLKAQPKKP